MVAHGKVPVLGGAPSAHSHAESRVAGRRLQLEPPLGRDHSVVVLSRIAVARGAVREHAARETELEVDGLFHLLEALVAWSRVRHRVDFYRLLPRHVARGLQAVYADVHQGAPAREALLEPPLGGIADVEAVVGHDDLDRPQLLLARHPDHLFVEWLVSAAVGHHQLPVRLARGVDHRLAIGRRVRHGLFGKHVLARLMPADGVLGVHPVGQDDVDDVDLGVVLEGVVVLIVVDALFLDAVAQGELARLVRMAADQRDHPGLLAPGERGQDLVDGEAAEADDGPSHLLARRLGDLLRRSAGRERPESARRGQTLARFRQEPPARDVFVACIGHGHNSFCDAVAGSSGVILMPAEHVSG